MTEQEIINRFATSLYESKGSLFVGAGISSGSGAPGWFEAIKQLAQEKLGIAITDRGNLPLIAQYIVNRDMGNRGPLIGELRTIYHRTMHRNNYHNAIRLMNVRSIWTTNYDALLEQTFSGAHVTVLLNDDHISRPVPSADIEIVKMHGCINSSPHNEIVITQQDYEDYSINRPATVQRLQHDLMTRSFLFVGYSFRDANVANILTVARRLSGTATQSHYLITVKKLDEPLLQYWYSDLRRVGIEVYEIEQYVDLERILLTLAKKSIGRTVYFTGSHMEQEAEEKDFCSDIGRLIAEMDSEGKTSTVLMDGQSTGRSRLVVSAFLNALIGRRVDVRKHVKYFSNPYSTDPALANKRSLLPTLKSWRAPLMKATQLVVAFDGGMGTKAEVELAEEYQCRLLPVPRTRNGSAMKLLNDNDVARRITECCPEYVGKAKALTLAADDVAKCVHCMLNS